MMELSPPSTPPRVAVGDRPHDAMRRRLHLILYSTVTIFLTAWFCTMGPVPAILALVVAKHVLVAILLLGIDVNRERQAA